MRLLNLRSGSSGPLFEGEEDGDILVWDSVAKKWGIGRQPTTGLVDVTQYGARNDGVGDPSEGFRRAAVIAATVGGSVYAPRGVYGDGRNWVFDLPSGVELVGDGDGTQLVNLFVTNYGVAGDEIPFTAPAAKGATSIAIPADGLTDAWLRISSCINMQSTNAGDQQLGHDASAMGFFSEFVQVKQGNVASADLQGATVWPYSNTPGSDSGTFTTSVARVIQFAEASALRKVKFVGKNSLQNHNVLARFAQALLLDRVSFDSSDVTNQCIRFLYCLDCHVINCEIVGKKRSVPAGSTANPVVFMSSQSCTAHDSSIYNGNQGLDVDCIPNDQTYRGGPSMFCGASLCRGFNNATEGFTSHFGCYGSFFSTCSVTGSPRGVRVRDRGSRVSDCRLQGAAAAGVGVLVDNAAWWDAEVSDNVIDGYFYSVQQTQSAAGYEALQALLASGSTEIHHNTCRGAGDHGIYLNVAYALASMCGPAVYDNEIHSPVADGIRIGSYFNGANLRGNRVSGIRTGQSALRYSANIKRLHLGPIYALNVAAGGFAVRGPSTTTFMTDLAVFPGGEAEGQLYVGDVYTDAAVPFQSLIRDVAAYLAPRRTGFQAFTAGMGNVGPTSERQTFGIYQRIGSGIGQTLLVDTRDAANNFLTHQLVFRTAAADPNGVLTGSPGDLASSTATGALWRKTSGINTNTGWVTP